jgi:hypothetical protein
MIALLKLKWLEAKLTFGEFGKGTKYRRLCLERNATTNAAKLQIAQEVIDGRGVGIAECWAHTIYLREHESYRA